MPAYHEGGENGNFFQSQHVVLRFQFDGRRFILLRNLQPGFFLDEQDVPDVFQFQLRGPDRLLFLRNLQ